MLVVSDASPLNVLVSIELIHVLPALYQAVVIPDAVADEMSHPQAPDAVQNLIASKPSWLNVGGVPCLSGVRWR